MGSIISVKDLNKSYNHTKAVDNLEFSVQAGNFFGFLGPNGAGKTTTIRMLTGIAQPDSGHVEICGFKLSEKEKLLS